MTLLGVCLAVCPCVCRVRVIRCDIVRGVSGSLPLCVRVRVIRCDIVRGVSGSLPLCVPG